MSEDEQFRREGEEGIEEYRDDPPETVPLDLEAVENELGALGWELVEKADKRLWRNPNSGHLYPQGAAIALIRAGKLPGASTEKEDDS
jgi:hypothetical protein